MHAGRKLVLPVAFSLAAVACSPVPSDRPVNVTERATVTDGEIRVVPSWFRRVDTIVLQEGQSRVVVSPIVARLYQDTLLLVDVKERRISLHRKTGEVIWDHASRGSGPGELELPIAAEITSEGVWVADIFNGVFLLDRKSKREIRRLRNGSNAIQGLSALNDSTLLLVGRGPVEKGRSSWIHALDARTGKTLWNALSITESALPPRSVRAFGFASAHNSGGNVVASFSLVDTVYIFDDKGRERVKVHAPLVDITGLSQIGSERPDRKVMDKVVRIIGAFSVGDSVVVVSTQRGSARNPQYGMARIYKSEPLRFEHVQNTPLMIGQTAGQLIGAFVDPIRPNRLVLLTDKSWPQ
ncbi:MAG: hypothetical protein HEQ38_06055 [Gemmatimonas sp.]|nr:hypothetical protein [Gemmatimonas sp.]